MSAYEIVSRTPYLPFGVKPDIDEESYENFTDFITRAKKEVTASNLSDRTYTITPEMLQRANIIVEDMFTRGDIDALRESFLLTNIQERKYKYCLQQTSGLLETPRNADISERPPKLTYVDLFFESLIVDKYWPVCPFDNYQEMLYPATYRSQTTVHKFRKGPQDHAGKFLTKYARARDEREP
jgi:hypothetical protein